MSALERLEQMPDWPARMTAPVAAMYMGISQNTFLARFGDKGVKEGTNTLWAKAQLDRIVAVQFDLGNLAAQPGPVDEYTVWKAGLGR